MIDIAVIPDVAVPAVVWLLMLVVGLELSIADFRRVVEYPKAVIMATLGQLVLLPLIALLLIWVLLRCDQKPVDRLCLARTAAE